MPGIVEVVASFYNNNNNNNEFFYLYDLERQVVVIDSEQCRIYALMTTHLHTQRIIWTQNGVPSFRLTSTKMKNMMRTDVTGKHELPVIVVSA